MLQQHNYTKHVRSGSQQIYDYFVAKQLISDGWLLTTSDICSMESRCDSSPCQKIFPKLDAQIRFFAKSRYQSICTHYLLVNLFCSSTYLSCIWIHIHFYHSNISFFTHFPLHSQIMNAAPHIQVHELQLSHHQILIGRLNKVRSKTKTLLTFKSINLTKKWLFVVVIVLFTYFVFFSCLSLSILFYWKLLIRLRNLHTSCTFLRSNCLMPLKNNHISNSIALEGYCFVVNDNGNIEEK